MAMDRRMPDCDPSTRKSPPEKILDPTMVKALASSDAAQMGIMFDWWQSELQ